MVDVLEKDVADDPIGASPEEEAGVAAEAHHKLDDLQPNKARERFRSRPASL
jgi:hypothetical protein